MAVFKAVSAKPFLDPWVVIKYSKGVKPSIYEAMIGKKLGGDMLLRSTDGEMLGKILILSHQMQDKREINITLIFLDAVPEKESVIIAYEDKDLRKELGSDENKILALVTRYFHCG